MGSGFRRMPLRASGRVRSGSSEGELYDCTSSHKIEIVVWSDRGLSSVCLYTVGRTELRKPL